MAVSPLDFVSALTAARAIRRGDVSSVELTTRMLGRIQHLNPRLNAIVTLTADAALARAEAADAALARGEWWGPFHGVPGTIKDTFEMTGVRTTGGNPAFANYVPKADATVVSRLRAAGMVILGKTNVPFMAHDVQSYNDIFGTTSNPWDLSRTPGGSSGGEAAALAAGLRYLGVGSDIGGSIRTPAHFCGVYGHKPTLGVVPLRGHVPPPPGTPPLPPAELAVAGPMARAAGDLRAALEVLGGPDGDEARAYRWALPAPRGSRVSDYRIGFVLDDPACPVSTDVGDVVAQAVDALRRAGAKLDEGWPPGVAPAEQHATYLYLLIAAFAYLLLDDQVEVGRQLAARQDGSLRTQRAEAWTAPHKDFQAAASRRMAARTAWQAYFRTHDAFLMPSAFVPAFPHDHSEAAPGPLVERLDERVIITANGPRAYSDMFFWISFATLTGLPATTAPAGLTPDGLPVGVQIIGPYLEDATPIDIAGRLADVTGGPGRRRDSEPPRRGRDPPERLGGSMSPDAVGWRAGRALTPVDRALEPGDLFHIEIGGVERRYNCVAMQTMIVPGAMPGKAGRDLYDVALRCLRAGLAQLRPGVPAAEVEAPALEIIRGAGRGDAFKMRFGYGVGIGYPPSWLEPLQITRTSTDVLNVGTTFVLHACLLDDAESVGVLVGGTYAITDAGYELLSGAGDVDLE